MNRNLAPYLTCALLVFGAPAALAAAGPRATVDPAVRDALSRHGAKASLRVIARVHEGAKGAVRSRHGRRGVRFQADDSLSGMLGAEISSEQLVALENDPDVGHISLDMPVTTSAVVDSSNAAATASNILLSTLGVDVTTPGGTGVGVAVIDSGIQPTTTMMPAASFDFTHGSGTAMRPADEYGHGTHVAGLIAAGGSVRGVAPAVRLISLKVLDGSGQGMTSSVIAAIDFAIANKRRLGIDIINLSLGHPITEPAADDPLVQAVEAASRAGIIVVVAAGNCGRNAAGTVAYGGVMSPANAASALTVGAFDAKGTVSRRDDTVPTYSSRGPAAYDLRAKPDFVAPGHELVSAAAVGSLLYTKYPERRVIDSRSRTEYLRLSGTSMAAAVTSGVVALMLDEQRTRGGDAMTANDVKAILQFSSIEVLGENYLSQGAGAVNVRGALSLVRDRDLDRQQTLSGSHAAPVPFTVVGSENYIWTQAIVWGNTIVWGNSIHADDLAFGQTIVWGNAVVWGESALTPSSVDVVNSLAATWRETLVAPAAAAVVDGSTIVWGNAIVWGNTIVWGNAELALLP